MRPKIKARPIADVTSGFEISITQPSLAVSGITHNSKEVQAGDIYVALKGSNYHGIDFADQAIASGAVAIASDDEGLKKLTSKISTIKLNSPRADMAVLAARVYDHPEEKLTLVGVTGTNGKTSVTHILQSLFTNFGYQVGVIGTLGTYINNQHLPLSRTTPESTDLYALLAIMVEEKITHVFMEVSSHALEMHRVDGLFFSEVVFTNLSQDHLDFHGSMENYFAAKARLFTSKFANRAVICIQDSWGKKLVSQTEIPLTTVGENADWEVSNLRLTVTNSEFNLIHNESVFNCVIPMIGAFNAVNAAVAVAVSAQLGLDPKLITRDLINVHPVPGRSQIVTHNSPGTAIVDYAHTPEAVEKILTTLHELCDGQLITVLGCGGDRDATKRPLMGEIAARISDVLIITDDNPRSEKPEVIRAAIKSGIDVDDTKVLEIADRKLAIKKALEIASNSDVIAVLGKGHEHGQEINGKIFPFNDADVIQEVAK